MRAGRTKERPPFHNESPPSLAGFRYPKGQMPPRRLRAADSNVNPRRRRAPGSVPPAAVVPNAETPPFRGAVSSFQADFGAFIGVAG
jgi:hypothetical protein